VRKTLLVALVMVSCQIPLMAWAQQGDRSWVLRGVVIAPDETSQTIADTGSRLAVDSSAGAELAFTYLATRSLAVEAALSVTRLDLSVLGGTADGLDAGTVWTAPVTLTLQYRVPLFSDYHPYAGVGVAWGGFFGYELASDVEAVGLVDMEWQGSAGLVAQAGLDYDSGEKWFVNLDLAYLDLTAEVELLDHGRHLYDEIELELDPWVIGLGVGHRF